jgi:MoxR-like ATPase
MAEEKTVKARIRSFESMEAEYGLDSKGNILVPEVWTLEMEDKMPADRLITLTEVGEASPLSVSGGNPDYRWSPTASPMAYRISTEMVETFYPTKKTKKEKTMETTETVGKVTATFEEIIEKATAPKKEEEGKKKKALPEIVEKIMKYAFKKHILLEGEKGSGKTYSIDKFLSEEGIDTVFTAGAEGLESIDLLGYLIPDKSGELVWKDGALTEAFRRAQDHPVVLFFDELLRVPGRELNILVGALSPNSRGEYVLRTGRVLEVIDGIAIEETLVVPEDRLWVIGTTNVGAGYAVDDIDEALSDRFRIVRKDTDEKEMTKILDSMFPAGTPSKTKELMKLYKYMQKLRKEGDIDKIVNLRHLVESVKFSDLSKESIVANLLDLVPHWVNRDSDGYINAAQKSVVLKAIKQSFNID